MSSDAASTPALAMVRFKGTPPLGRYGSRPATAPPASRRSVGHRHRRAYRDYYGSRYRFGLSTYRTQSFWTSSFRTRLRCMPARPLTPRELEVLLLVGQGVPTPEIA